MLDLEQFYKKLYQSIDQNDRYDTILEIDDVIVVNFDTLFDRECSIRAADQLIYLLHKLGQGKRFLFLSEDGALLQQSGAVEIIKNIVDCFSLNKHTCLVVCREELDIPNITVINNEAVTLRATVRARLVDLNSAALKELDAIDRQLEQNKSGKKIIGFNFKNAIKGRWTKMLAAKKIQILQQIDPKIISENGIHQAMLQAQSGGKIGKGM